jgi:hypothetical protein
MSAKQTKRDPSDPADQRQRTKSREQASARQ